MYVNMHELASLAASKAQEMASFPPPPPELVSQPHTEKVWVFNVKIYIPQTKAEYCLW